MNEYRVRGLYWGFKTIILFIAALVSFQCTYAQIHREEPYKEPEGIPRPRNVKLLDEHKDNKGNIVRTIQYEQGLMKVTETVIMPQTVGVGVRVPIRADTMNKELVLIEVDKTHYCLDVYYRKRMIRSYKAVFGPHPLIDKMTEGDRCTPEGWFTITNKNPVSRYNKFMLLSYPNDSTFARFNRLKTKGLLPQSARIGGSVGIHGIWPGGDDMIEMGVGWTDGCVALKNKDVEELYTMVGVGTKVYIKK